jgi:hypothetical protein
MNKVIRVKIEMGDRVVEIGTNPELALTAPMTALFTQAATHTATLKEWAADQSSGFGGFRAGALESRRTAGELRTAMLEISGIAKVLKPAELPGARELFRMPRNGAFQKLLAGARHFATTVEPVKALFIARALPLTFVEDLEAKIAAFETAVGQKAGGRVERIGGTSGLDTAARALLEAVQELRAIMRVHLKAKPELLAAFRSAARVERASRKKVVAGGTPTPSTEPPAGS